MSIEKGAEEVKEILPNGRDVVDIKGDVRSRHDFPRDEYPEPSKENLVLGALESYEEYLHLKTLTMRDCKDKDVRREGGIRACRQKRKDLLEKARKEYLEANDIYVVHQPIPGAPDYDDKIDEYYRGVGVWIAFRDDVLDDPDTREVVRTNLEQQIQVEKYTTL